MGSPTANYGWTKPAVGGDGDAWGGELNADLDGIDSTVKSVSNVANAALPIAGGTLTGPVLAAADPTAALGVATKQYVDGVRYGDNRLINGDMRIDQRNNGASGTLNGYTADRWYYAGSQTGKGTWQQVPTSCPGGFAYALRFTSSSAYAVTAADNFQFIQIIEADVVSDFQWGTVNAQPVALSFWVFSSLSGTFGGAVHNQASTRAYPFSYSIPAASTWIKIVINIPGDTTGTWVASGNAGSLQVDFSLGTGATYSGPANAWASVNYVSVTGAVSVVGTNAATFYLTGVKLETGSIATPFNRQSLAKSLADCQRYYQTIPTWVGYSPSIGASGSWAFPTIVFPVQMRTTPTITTGTITYSNCSGLALTNANNSPTSWLPGITASAAGNFVASGAIFFSAEL